MYEQNGWIKYFADGTVEEGYDHLVQAKKASWSRGRLEGIIGVSMTHGDITVTLESSGKFWQEDTLEAIVGKNGSRIVERRIFKQIHELDTYCISTQTFGKNYKFVLTNTPVGSGVVKRIGPEELGKWFTVCLSDEHVNLTIGDR